jgi:hypothetical protein
MRRTSRRIAREIARAAPAGPKTRKASRTRPSAFRLSGSG